jgi:L-ascorbate metabolism protein UlaG (beta-lactamase superfamily)
MRTPSLVLSLATLLAVPGLAAAQAPAAKPVPPAAAPAKPSITWYGHAAFRVTTPRGKSILIDPWLTNPSNPNGKADAAQIPADLILVSHGHADHVGDAVAIAKRTKAKLVATYDLGNALVATGFPRAQAGMDTQGNVGGVVTVLDGEVKIAFVPAVHSSQVAKDDKSPGLDGGAPGGFLVMIDGGPTIYHTGDTDVFGDMALIPQFAPVDVMLACIGGHFTMDPSRAARAAKLVKPKSIVPMHYGTFPLLAGTPEQLAKELKQQGVRAKLEVKTIGK